MPSDFIICPSCGERNIQGEDLCWNCMAGLSAIDIPETAQPISESALTRPLSSLRLRLPATIAPTQPVSDAIALLRANPAGAIVVVDGGTITGIFTERDVLHRVAGKANLPEPVGTFMTPDPVVVSEDDMMAVVLNKMGDGGFRHLPIARNGDLVGMVTAKDVARWVLLNYFD
jgi:CBS domain-containing protein